MSQLGVRKEPIIEDYGRPAKVLKSSVSPTNFSYPRPHTHQCEPRHPWERDFESLLCTLRLKPDWTKKVMNKEITTKWRIELDRELDYMWDRAQEELQYRASLATEQCEPTSVDGVWIKDGAIPKALHDEFISEIAEQLENKEKDFHPFSGDTIVDLIHPSLHCYVHGRTQIVQEENSEQLVNEENWNAFLSQSAQPNMVDIPIKDTLNFIRRAKAIEGGNPIPREEEEEEEEGGEEEEGEDVQNEEPTGPVPQNNRLGRRWERVPLSKAILDTEKLFHFTAQYEEPDEELLDGKRAVIDHIASVYRWLPAELSVAYSGEVTFHSYINGLHPFKNQKLYGMIERIMSHMVPLWESVLTDLVSGCPHNQDRLRYRSNHYETPYDSESLSELWREDQDTNLLNSLPVMPDRPLIDFAGGSYQVIVKLASIELTPKKPIYQGTWHIEGVPEEDIISTGIYYFAEENIKETFLHFREAIYDPSGSGSIQCPMGFGFGSSMNRNVGKVATKQGRLLAFPNILQHRVGCKEVPGTITLEDRTKAGFRKMLVFFLVKPSANHHVISTKNVQPTNKAWYPEGNAPPQAIDLETAKKDREHLMFTRKYYVSNQNQTLYERSFSFCEH